MTDVSTHDAKTLTAALNNPELRTTCEAEIFAAAEDILMSKLVRLGTLTNPRDTAEFFRMRLGRLEHEEFHAAWLDNRHRVIGCDRLFIGTVDGASVHPREVVKRALAVNAVACVFAHGHPSGVQTPSAADRAITRELREALQLVGVRLLDHLVVSADAGAASMAEMGWI